MSDFYARPAEDREALLRELEAEALPSAARLRLERAACTTVDPAAEPHAQSARRRALARGLDEAGVGWTRRRGR